MNAGELRVLILIDSLAAGGAERSMAAMLPGLVTRNINPVVACFHRRDEGVEAELVAQGHEVRHIAEQSLVGRARAVRRILAEGFDLLHTQLYEADVAGRLAAMGSATPVLSSLVNTSYDPERLRDPNVNRYKLAGVRSIDGLTARHLTARFHAISRAVEEASVKALRIDPARVTVIERGRDPASFEVATPIRRAEEKRALGIDPDTPLIVSVGRQEYQKGHRYLLAAAATFTSRSPRPVLLVAGRTGNATRELEALHAELELGDQARLLGYREDVPQILAAADLFVFPSLFEGIGGAVIEAMAAGLAVVASDIPAMREILEPGGNALLVPVGDAEALAVAIERLLDDTATAARYGQRSRAIFETRFTLDPVVDRMADLYREVAAGGRT